MRYIHIRNWPEFQHPDTMRGKRGMPWIRDYTAQLHDEDWVGIGFADRGLLQALRLQYAATRGRGINDSTTNLSRLLGHRVYRSQLDRLSDAGFIEFSASKLQAERAQLASLEETETRQRQEPRAVPVSSGETNGPGDSHIQATILASLEEARKAKEAA